MRRRTKIISFSILGLIIIVFGGLAFAGNYFYNIALNPHADRAFLQNNLDLGDSEQAAAMDEQAEADAEREADAAWMENTPHKDVSLTSYDGLNLRGYEYLQEKPSNKWVIIVHGYMGWAKQNGFAAKEFRAQGYNVLAVDLRGHGESEGDYIGMGWHDRKDIVDWINGIVRENSDAEIVLYGVSMGGATVMMTSGEDLPANVKAIVEDCGYTSAKDEFSYQLKRIFHLPSFPILNAADVVTQIRAGYSFGEASAVKQVAKSKTPILFIHGDADTFVPYEMVHEVYEAATVEKDLLIIEGAGHGEAHKAGDVYWNKIWDFTNLFMTA
ncbi:alpha/beta hydrolase [Paenibacillus selenitireducens]|uniref:Alpha/beta hydrolase n=1 Tax=Paenibacillus selenitireducens TaxID=1324314 RepID=A0A1T2X1W6_9BACL|nr:alpha/beta hydrolase [Paenibacillus selenitireducens]OPA73888.1 alpha/beta hydrolase [Paenibacillus selenitireducens]